MSDNALKIMKCIFFIYKRSDLPEVIPPPCPRFQLCLNRTVLTASACLRLPHIRSVYRQMSQKSLTTARLTFTSIITQPNPSPIFLLNLILPSTALLGQRLKAVQIPLQISCPLTNPCHPWPLFPAASLSHQRPVQPKHQRRKSMFSRSHLPSLALNLCHLSPIAMCLRTT